MVGLSLQLFLVRLNLEKIHGHKTFQRAQINIEMTIQKSQPAIFFDRDGTLNVDEGYTHKPEDLKWIEGAKRLIKKLNAYGYLVFVVTNQSGVARGYYNETAVKAFHLSMQNELFKDGAWIDDYVYCPHHPSGKIEKYTRPCNCRKPAIGMLEKLTKKWHVDLSKSVFVGDRESDMDCAKNFGIKGIRFRGPNLYDLLPHLVSAVD